LPSKTEEQRERAEAKFERLQKVAEEGRIAMAEYKAAALAMRQKTERLRALRLADQIHAKPTKSPRKQTKKRTKVH
jgi:hypothetical protein